MMIVGVTGGIAGGKSAVTSMLGGLGAQTRSADDDARAVLAGGSPLLAEVFATFPEAEGDRGALDRANLARRIFADPTARGRLQAITHPAIIARMTGALGAARAAGSGVLVYETPLLYEARLESLFDAVIAVLATPELQRARLQARERAAGRDPLTEDDLSARLGAQLPPEEKARRADFVIRTDGMLADTEAQVRRVWDSLYSSQA